MRPHWNLLLAAAENVAGSPKGYAVAAAGLVVGLGLLLCGVAISEGVRTETLSAVDSGADLYCSWDAFGRDAALPVDKLAELSGLTGVVRAVPRIIGRVPLGDQQALVVGVPLEELARHPLDVVGEVPDAPAELLLGHELARSLGLGPGDRVALDAHALRIFEVAGVVSSSSSLWSARALVIDLEEAAILFGDRDHVTDVCLTARPGYAARLAESVTRLDRRLRVQTKDLVLAYVQRGMTLREGVFSLLVALALALAIPAFAVMTFLAHGPRRREIGLLKAEGWRTSEVLEMVALENLIVSVAAAALATLLAVVWVRLLGAPLIAPLFLPELPLFPEMRIPARFLPLPPLLALLFSVAVTMPGSIYTTWRTATARPAETLR